MKFSIVFGLVSGTFFIIQLHAQTLESNQSLQRSMNPNITSLIEAERSFARLASDSNTHTAFLAFLADKSLMFRNGEIKNGKELYGNVKDDQGLLTWEPIFADVAASGDFGYDTGPSEFRKSRSDEKPVYYGDFVSVWEKASNNQWKVILDLGTGHDEPKAKPALTVSAIPLTNDQRENKTDFKLELTAKEKNFIASFSQSGVGAYSSVISKEARFFRAGTMPLITYPAIQEMLNQQNNSKKITYQLVDGNVAQSGDLGFVYGTATVEFFDNTKKIEKTNYVRIWKKENSLNWKIVVDVLLK
jgi:ketosteroid isomerase-like protein